VPAATVADPDMFRTVFDVLFPRRCVGCGGPGWPFCGSCAPAVGAFSPPWCERCGRSMAVAVPRCPDCPPEPISWSRSAFLYDGPVRAGLMRMKFGGARSVVEAFAEPMSAALAASGAPPSGAVLTWVPLGRRRRRTRGFDQAERLAEALARVSRLPIRPLLERTRETPPQARRSGAERRAALQGAFRCRAEPPATVVLVDDVLTSGATTAECAGVLAAAGTREVGVVTAARSLGGSIPGRCYTAAPGPRPGSVVARETASR
jgi:competence protein ComFC